VSESQHYRPLLLYFFWFVAAMHIAATNQTVLLPRTKIWKLFFRQFFWKTISTLYMGRFHFHGSDGHETIHPLKENWMNFNLIVMFIGLAFNGSRGITLWMLVHFLLGHRVYFHRLASMHHTTVYEYVLIFSLQNKKSAWLAFFCNERPLWGRCLISMRLRGCH